MANKKTSAISVSKLASELEQREAELTILNSVQEGLASKLDMQGIYDLVGEKIREIFGANTVTLATFDLEKNLMYPHYAFEKGQRFFIEPLSIPEVYREFIQRAQPLLINSNIDEYIQRLDPNAKPLAGEMPKSVLAVPLIMNGVLRGIVSLQNIDHKNAFSESDLRLLQTLANSMSVALENARLFDETQRRNAELAIINSIQAGLANKLEMQAIYNLIGEKIRNIFKAETIAINQYDLEHDLISTPYLWSRGKRLLNEEPAPLSDSPLLKFMIEARRSWIIHRYSEDIPNLLSARPDEQLGRWPKSGIITPVIASEKVIGIIQIVNMEQENTYTDADLHLLETISNGMSVALENARLFDETQRLFKAEQERVVELQVINSIQQGLASKLDMQGIYDLVGDAIGGIFPDAEAVLIYSIDLQSKHLDFNYALEKGQRLHLDPDFYENQPYEVFYNKLAHSTEPLVINSNCHAFMIENGLYVVEGTEEPKSAIFIPLIAGDRVLSQISLQNIERENAFTDSDIRLLSTLAGAMSVALENARLWEQEKLYRKALQRELDIGREIQLGFLPETLPVVDGWEIAASLMSAREVAGDFYDAFELPDGNIGLVIADVCDKGVGAALFMTLFRSLIRAAANLDYFEQTEEAYTPHSPIERLQRAVSLTNNYIAETHGDSGMFATLFFGILDPRDGKLIYVNGGHESPLILRTGAVRESLRKTGPAVGALPNFKFGICQTQLQSGDTFFAYTDGVPDCQNPRGEFFGRERLHEILRENCSAGNTVKAIETDLRQYISSATQFDDITLLAVRRLPKSANL